MGAVRHEMTNCKAPNGTEERQVSMMKKEKGVMNKTKRRSFVAVLFALVCAFVLVFSLGMMSACGNETAGTESGEWYYGAAVPSDTLGQEGDCYLNTKTLSSYKKTSGGWTLMSAEDAPVWHYGTQSPDSAQGKENDFYLNTQTGELYQKGAEGWGEPILNLTGQKGRDGVMWFSGTVAPQDSTDPALKGAIAGDFYINTSTWDVYQLATNGKDWTHLGTIKGDDAIDPVQFYDGKGYPENNGELLKDAQAGDLYVGQFDGKDGNGAGSRLYRYDGEKWNVIMESIKANQVEIYSLEELIAFGESVTKENSYAGKEVHLKVSIDFNAPSGVSYRRSEARAITWKPIGTAEAPFKGTFDGEGNTIENFTVTTSDTGARVGFFGYVENATIKDLKFVNASVTATEAATGAAGGVLAGEVSGRTTLTGVKVESSSVTAESMAGGLVGKTAEESDLTVKDSSSEIVVEGGDKVSTEWSENNEGSEPDSTVFEIPSEEGLMAFAEKVNAGDTFEGVTVVLNQDMDLSGETWVPIGTEANPFAGNFNGNHKKIENLSFTNTGVTGSTALKYGGFFGVLCGTDDAENPQTISDLTLSVSIDDQANDSRMGGLSGKAYGNILVEKVTVNGSVSSVKIASGFFGDVKYESDKDQTRTGKTCVTVKNSNNYADILAPKGVGYAANVNGVSLTLENCENHGDISLPEGATNDVVMGGFTGYIQGNGEIITFSDCTNFGDITIKITAHIGKFSVGGISGGGRSEHNYTNVVNNGSITVDDRETEESVQTKNIVGEIGGLIGSASGTKHLKHVENNGDISVTTINQRNYGVGGLFGQGNAATLEVGANDKGVRSIVKCTIEVKSTTEVPATEYRVAGTVTGYKANAATKIENTDITVTISPMSTSNYGLSGDDKDSSDFTHEGTLYTNIKNVTYHVTAPDSEGIYEWDEAGNLKQTLAMAGVYDDAELLEAVKKINSGEINGIKLCDHIEYTGTATQGVGYVGGSNKSKLQFTSDNVTIDLNGKTLTINSLNGYDSIAVKGSSSKKVENFVIKNGTITMDKTTDDGVIYLTYASNATLEKVTVNAGPHADVAKSPNNLPLAIYSNRTQLTIDSSTINGAISTNGEDKSLLIAKDSFLKGMLNVAQGNCILLRTEFAGGVDVEGTVEQNSTSKWGIHTSAYGLVAVDCHLKGDLQLYSGTMMSFIGGTVEGNIMVRDDGTNNPSVWFNGLQSALREQLEQYEIDPGDVANAHTKFVGDRKFTHKPWINQDRGLFRELNLKNCDIEGVLTIDAPIGNYSATGCTGTIIK